MAPPSPTSAAVKSLTQRKPRKQSPLIVAKKSLNDMAKQLGRKARRTESLGDELPESVFACVRAYVHEHSEHTRRRRVREERKAARESKKAAAAATAASASQPPPVSA